MAKGFPLPASSSRAQELCESPDGRPGLPVPNKPDGFCGCKATLKLKLKQLAGRVQELCESRGGRPGLSVPNKPDGVCRRKAIIIIIIMYIYHALINALSAHMIHINLNMIFYTHVKHSPTKTSYEKYYLIA